MGLIGRTPLENKCKMEVKLKKEEEINAIHWNLAFSLFGIFNDQFQDP